MSQVRNVLSAHAKAAARVIKVLGASSNREVLKAGDARFVEFAVDASERDVKKFMTEYMGETGAPQVKWGKEQAESWAMNLVPCDGFTQVQLYVQG